MTDHAITSLSPEPHSPDTDFVAMALQDGIRQANSEIRIVQADVETLRQELDIRERRLAAAVSARDQLAAALLSHDTRRAEAGET